MDNGISLIIMTTMEQSIENLYKLDGRVPVGKSTPIWSSACAGDVCQQYCANHDSRWCDRFGQFGERRAYP